MAVYMNLLSREERDPAAHVVCYVNQHNSRTIIELRCADFKNPKLRTPNERRLLSCWFDFAFLRAQLDSAHT